MKKEYTEEELRQGYHDSAWGHLTTFACIKCRHNTESRELAGDHYYQAHVLQPRLMELRKQGIDVSSPEALAAYMQEHGAGTDAPLYGPDEQLITKVR